MKRSQDACPCFACAVANPWVAYRKTLYVVNTQINAIFRRKYSILSDKDCVTNIFIIGSFYDILLGLLHQGECDWWDM